MKRVLFLGLILIGALIVSSVAFAGAPRLVNYQGTVSDAGGPLDGPYDISFTLYPDSLSSMALWTELHVAVPVDDGLFNVILGRYTAIPDSLFERDELWIGITIGNDPEIDPRMRLTSVPWAIRAGVADSALTASGIPSHNHDDLYYNENELNTSGVINDPSNPVDWTKLKNVPAGFADGVDDGGGGGGDITAVIAGDGLAGGGDVGDVIITVLPGHGIIVDPVDGVSVQAGEGISVDPGIGVSIAVGGVQEHMLGDSVVTGAKIASNSITAAQIAPGTITAGEIQANTITSLQIAPSTITSAQIAASTITAGEIASKTITAGQIAAQTITSGEIQGNTITAAQLATSAVDTDEITAGAVTAAKLGADAVTTDKILNGTILLADFNQNGADSGQVMKWNGTAWSIQDDAVGGGGDITGVTAGDGLTGGGATGDVELDVDFGTSGTALTVARSDHDHDADYADIVHNHDASYAALGHDHDADYAALGHNHDAMYAAIVHDHDADYVNEGQANSVTSGMITDGEVGTNDIGTGAVTEGKLGTGAVTADKLGTGAVTNAKLGADAVTTDRIQNGTILFGDIGQNGAADGQVMKWSDASTAWIAAEDLDSGGGGGGWVDDGIVVRLETATDSVGIGTSTPSARLHVVGNMRADGKGAFGPGSNDGMYSFMAGYMNNVNGDYATVGGGEQNTAFEDYAVVGGGRNNQASGQFGIVGGGFENVVAEEYSVIGGGRRNSIEGRYAVVVGGGEEMAPQGNRALSDYSVIGGGRRNTAGLFDGGPPYPGLYATVSGGYWNKAVGEGTTVGGGEENVAGDETPSVPEDGEYATVGGGRRNRAEGRYSTICGGGGTDMPDEGNQALGDYSFIGGGRRNHADQQFAVVSGGENNWAEDFSTVGGGMDNGAFGSGSTVGGGSDNHASQGATVGGGMNNFANGSHATIPGGHDNSATGQGSFAAGTMAKAHHDGSIVLAASNAFASDDSVWTGGSEQLVIRADGGIYITDTNEQAPYQPTRLINTSTGAYLDDVGQWRDACDRSLKENFTDIDGSELLERVASLSVTMWNYKREGDEVKHIGPVAQDFHAVFGVGDDDRTIAPMDAAGISLASVKELYRRACEQEKEIERLSARIEELEKDRDRIEELESLIRELREILQRTGSSDTR